MTGYNNGLILTNGSYVQPVSTPHRNGRGQRLPGQIKDLRVKILDQATGEWDNIGLQWKAAGDATLDVNCYMTVGGSNITAVAPSGGNNNYTWSYTLPDADRLVRDFGDTNREGHLITAIVETQDKAANWEKNHNLVLPLSSASFIIDKSSGTSAITTYDGNAVSNNNTVVKTLSVLAGTAADSPAAQSPVNASNPGGNFKKVQIRIWDGGPSSGGKVFTGGSSWGTEVTDTPSDTNWFDTTSSAAYSAGSSSGTLTYTMPAPRPLAIPITSMLASLIRPAIPRPRSAISGRRPSPSITLHLFCDCHPGQ